MKTPHSVCPRDSSSESSSASSSLSHTSATLNGVHIRLGVSAAAGRLTVETALPLSVFQYVASSKEVLLLSDSSPLYQTFAQSDPYFSQRTRPPKALLCLPVLRGGEVDAVLFLTNEFNASAFSSTHVELLQLLCTKASLALHNVRLLRQLESTNADLQTLVAQRTSEIQTLQVAMDAAEKAMKIKSGLMLRQYNHAN